MSIRPRVPGPLVLLGLLGVALAAPVLMRPGFPADVAAVVAAVAAVAYAWRAGGRAAWLAAGTLVAFRVVTAVNPFLPVSWDARLVVEAWTTLFPVVAFAALARSARALVRHPPRSAVVLLGLATGIAGFGALVRLAAIYFLWPAGSGSASTILYALRYDAAASLWAFAGAAVAGAALALATTTHHPPAWNAWRRHVTAGAALSVVLLVGLDAGSLAMATFDPGADMQVGYHSSRVAHVPEAADVVHMEAAWAHIGRSDGSYAWGRMDTELARAAERGLDVYLLVSTYPPEWFTDARPESVMTDSDGDPFYWIDSPPGEPNHRLWDVSFADPVARDAKRAFVEAAVARYGDHPSVKIVAVMNEPAYPVDWNLLRWASFDPFTVHAFREALRDEWDGDLARLNAEYGTAFASWDAVEPPTHPFGGYGERWIRFREDLLIDYVGDLLDAARNHTDKPVTTKIMAHFFTRFAEPQAGLSDRVNRAIADMSDVVSVDLYPVTKADLTRSLQYFHEIADGKPLWVAEFNLAAGLSLPGAGLRLVSALEIMDEYADGVILFTTHGHFLYRASEGTPGLAAVRVHAAQTQGGDALGPAVVDLLHREWENVLNLPGRAMSVLGFAGVLVGTVLNGGRTDPGTGRTRPRRRR